MNDANEYYRSRSQKLALQVIGLFSVKSGHPAFGTISKQLIRSAGSTASNYRAMCLGRSEAERYSKLCIVVEEADETVFWLELLHASGLIDQESLAPTLREAQELAKIFTAYRAKIKQSLSSRNRS